MGGLLQDPISALSGGISIAQGALQFLGYVRGITGANVISALFRWDGTRIEGSERIELEKHAGKDSDDVWWFSVQEVPEYTFLRIPVIESAVEELIGLVTGEKNPDVKYWRWISPARRGTIVGSNEPPNVKVDFIVVGYRPQALIKHFSSR